MFEKHQEIQITFGGHRKIGSHIISLNRSHALDTSHGMFRAVKPGPTKRAEICRGRGSFPAMMAERYLSQLRYRSIGFPCGRLHIRVNCGFCHRNIIIFHRPCFLVSADLWLSRITGVINRTLSQTLLLEVFLYVSDHLYGRDQGSRSVE